MHFVRAPPRVFRQEVFALAQAILFVLIVAEEATRTTIVVQIQTQESLVIIGEGKTIILVSNRVKAILVGIVNRETE